MQTNTTTADWRKTEKSIIICFQVVVADIKQEVYNNDRNEGLYFQMPFNLFNKRWNDELEGYIFISMHIDFDCFE
jgi:hypothetical protein